MSSFIYIFSLNLHLNLNTIRENFSISSLPSRSPLFAQDRLKFYLMINLPFSLRKKKPIFSIERKFFKETTSTRILYAMHRYLDIFPRLGKKKKKRPVQFIERLPIYLLEIPSYDKSCGLVSRAQMSCSPFSSKIYARLDRNFGIFLIITRSILFCL